MEVQRTPEVAVLLPTYNGARFVQAQVRSLTQNATAFTLHWIDDNSSDNTREIVRATCVNEGIPLREWQQSQHLGYPSTFFQLIECVEADIYLFCDQDDIWQAGKIDATVTNLLPDLAAPVLCFSRALSFEGDEPTMLHEQLAETKLGAYLQESRMFMCCPTQGNTIGFTRPLRESFLRHKQIARAYASGHGRWMYFIAVATGKVRVLSNAPTTLYRRHGNNFTEAYVVRRGKAWISRRWRLEKLMRQELARDAKGFILASATLPPSPKVERLVALARLMATLDRRQSPAVLIRLVRSGAMWPTVSGAIWRAANYLCSDAKL